ncbi:MAG: response regulator [Candidatus Taylorbacteria bacterium]|nr:response regulator [Candidatus Taylorbacteria bacterium]
MAQKILIIEDDTFLAEVLVQKCTSVGYDATIEIDGKAGLEKMLTWKPDLVLLDILLPTMNGFDILRNKQNNPEIADIPVIVVTNSGDQAEISRFVELGVREFLVKARFDPGEIVTHVNEVLRDPVRKKFAVPAKDSNAPVTMMSQSTTLADSTNTVSKSQTTAFLQKKKIMWVEDDRFLSDLISRKLFLLGCNVDYAETGEEAMLMVEKSMPDIILLDILLPGMTGIEVLEKIKANPKVKNIPVIMLSNFSQENDIKHCFALGAEKYLVKATVTLDEIVEEIRIILQKRG